MFKFCKALTEAPELPATTLMSNCCYDMFYSCIALTTAPILPATVLAESCYNSMFRYCTSLTAAPVLLATTLVANCYNLMFDGCSKVNYVKALFTTTPGSDYTDNWLRNVPIEGTFVKNKDATWNVVGVSGVPDGWTVITE